MGNDSVASAAGSHPRHRLFGQATPGPTPHPTTGSRSPGQEDPSTRGAESATNPLTQRGFVMIGCPLSSDRFNPGPEVVLWRWVVLVLGRSWHAWRTGAPARLAAARM